MFTRKPDREEDKAASVAKPETKIATDTSPEAPAAAPLKLSNPIKESSQMSPSNIGEDLTVEGNVISKGELQLDGEIKGDVRCASLVIGDKALVEGNVGADDVIVRGRVIGSVRGYRVTLQSNSHVEGDVFHQSLAIEQGAYFEGKSRRSDEPLANLKLGAKEKSTAHVANTTPSTESRFDKNGVDSSPSSTRAAE